MQFPNSETHPNRTPNRISETDSHERTNERTNGEIGSDARITNLLQRVRTYADEPELIADFFEAVVEQWQTTYERQRWDVVRTGERDPIARHIRAAIWYRDGGRCVECHHMRISEFAPAPHLDHIIPWSAGGPDTSDNLRLLCERHNLERSNYVDFTRPSRPATWWCHRCYSRDGFAWSYYRGNVNCPFHNYGQDCRVAGAYWRALTAGEVADWHEREPLTSFPKLAYCAHCDAPGWTSAAL